MSPPSLLPIKYFGRLQGNGNYQFRCFKFNLNFYTSMQAGCKNAGFWTIQNWQKRSLSDKLYPNILKIHKIPLRYNINSPKIHKSQISLHFPELYPKRMLNCGNGLNLRQNAVLSVKKSRIRETKNLSTNADSSTDTTVGWTKKTQKPIFFF